MTPQTTHLPPLDDMLVKEGEEKEKEKERVSGFCGIQEEQG